MMTEYWLFDPSGNITALIPVPEEGACSPAAAEAVMNTESVCEQVGFVLPGTDLCDARLRMAGGEFCGNAALCTAALTAVASGVPVGSTVRLRIAVSGADEPVSVALDRREDGFFTGSVIMPPVTEVKGFAATLAHPMEAEDTACAALRFEGGALGTVYGATSSWPGRPKTLEVTGTRGTIVLKDHEIAEWRLADGSTPESVLSELQPGSPAPSAAPSPRPGAAHGSSRPDQLDYTLHQRCFEAFANSLEGGEPYPVDAAAARRSVALIESISKTPFQHDVSAPGPADNAKA